MLVCTEIPHQGNGGQILSNLVQQTDLRSLTSGWEEGPITAPQYPVSHLEIRFC